MKKLLHKDSSIVGGVRICNSVINNLHLIHFSSETLELTSVSKRFAARVIGKDKILEISNNSRKLKFYTHFDILFIKDGDTISHCFDL